MSKPKLVNEAWRPLYNRQMGRLRNLVAFVNRYPADEMAPTFRMAIKELRAFVACIKADTRPAPPMPHVERLGKIWEDIQDAKRMEYDDRMKRLEIEQARQS